ncbi:hypothetical protein ACP275_02G180400 [Erythranthe tilingii]
MDSGSHSDIVPTPVSNKKANSPPMAAAGVKSKSKDTRRRSRPYYFRVCKGNRNSQIMDSLPDELLFHILLHLPAEDIPNAAMVCRKWYRTTRARDFVHAHRSHHSVSGLVIHVLANNRLNCHPQVFVSMRNGRFDVSNFVHQIRRLAWCSCNGLILEYDFAPEPALLITNPITNQRFAAPPFPSRISILNHRRFGISYSPASMEYKVVYIYCDKKDVFQCAVLTVGGVDDKSWRRICTRHLSPTSKTHLLNDPIITLGFIHWAQCDTHTHVLTLNVDTETMTKYTLPQSPQGGYERRPKFYFSAGKSLSLFVVVSDLYLEGWDMKSESGEWTKLYNIDFTPRMCEFERFRSDEYSHVPFALLPLGWIKFREVLAFHFSYPSTVCTAYNLVTREFHFFELGSDACHHEVVPHTINNLEWLST